MTYAGLATEEQLLAFAAGGERAVARVRLVLVCCLFAIPAFQVLYYRTATTHLLTALGATTIALLLAVIFYALSRSRRFLHWLPYITSLSDVTLISAALCAFLFLGEPHTAVNNRLIWDVYLLAIAATALRPRRGVVAVITAVAIAQYLAIVVYADTHWKLNDVIWSPFHYGLFDWSSQIGRMFIMATAGILSLAIIRQITHISLLAGTDALTGIFNRTYFELRLDEEVYRALRYKRPLTLVMADIDHFKSINDTLGHEYGDQALIQVTQSLKRGLRSSDILFRYGGDELSILMPETRAEDAHAILLRIVESLRRISLRGRSITISAGIAALPADAQNSHALVQAADNHLYAAKDMGRDCIVTSATEVALPGPAA